MRQRERQSGPLFLKSEWLRLVSMLFMLIVLYMMIQRARDESVWRWLVNDGGMSASEPVTNHVSTTPAQDSGPSFEGPTDLDVDESEAAQELFQAVSDRTSLSVEEMPAYWRLWRWARAQSLQTLRQRARSDLSLSHFLELPDKYRGQIVRLRLHLRRSLSWEIGPEEKAGGAKQVYEAWGWSDESPNFYCIVFTDPPADMPIGPTVADEVTFYGYFLKLISYRDQQDKLRMAPLLIGRVHHHAGLPPASDQGSWMFWLLVGGGVILVLIVVRWTRSYAFPALPQKPVDKAVARASVTTWLAEQPPDDEDSQSLDLWDKPTG
jgi:hypothetical protein